MVNAFFAWLFKLIAEFLWGKATDAAGDAIDRKKSSDATKENASELERALEEGSDEEIEKRSEDLLNGNRS